MSLDNGWSRASTEEWNAILQLGGAEDAARVASRIWIARRGNTPYISVATLGRSSEILREQSAHFAEVLATNHDVLDEAVRCADAARETIDEIDVLPPPSRLAIGQILTRAKEMLTTVEEEMQELVGLINHETPRLRALHNAIGDELGRRYEEEHPDLESERDADNESVEAAEVTAPQTPPPSMSSPGPSHVPPSTVTIGGVRYELSSGLGLGSRSSSSTPSTEELDLPIIISAEATSESEYPRAGDTPPPEYFPAGTPSSIITSAHDDAALWGEVGGVSEELLDHEALRPLTPPPLFEMVAAPPTDDEDVIRLAADASLMSLGILLSTNDEGVGLTGDTEEEDDPMRAMPGSFPADVALRMFRVMEEDAPYTDPTFGDIWRDARQAEVARLEEEYLPEEIEWIRGPNFARDSETVLDPGPDYGEPYFRDPSLHSPRSSDSGAESKSGNQPEEALGPAEPRDSDECILKSIVTFAGEAELYSTYVDHQGRLYFKTQPVHALHPQRLENRIAHDLAMAEAILEFSSAYGLDAELVEDIYTWKPNEDDPDNRTQHGFRDTSPHLFPGQVTHERLASHDPEGDNVEALPGSRVRFMTQRIEHIANVNRPRSAPRIGISDQPTRLAKDLACLTAELDIGGTEAFMLFDSGSNTDSLTPEFARATNCRIFKLDEQVTLQLGCVGSRSRINYGARAPVNFGGIKGHAYYDLVNLDRYDGIIGTPFMIKHGLILDFGKREVRLPSVPRAVEREMDKVRGVDRPFCTIPLIPARSFGRAVTLEDLEDPNDCVYLPSLPDGYPALLELESDFLSGQYIPPPAAAPLPPTPLEADLEPDSESEEWNDQDHDSDEDGDTGNLPANPLYFFIRPNEDDALRACIWLIG
ncbi:hypothetical protein DFH07DRAFT_765283 [Mycena maculata]|uniref:Uncharacterized protein n=1 Tax=Mycena maculata TaxID=230809 RepID=A0AAD7KAU1_9AGAR|nr:hypothetical protein DFH07DRAFT_765283 [Mycena maculata]